MALDAVSIAVAGERIGLVGVNGAGKTTLLSVAGGALKPTSGDAAIGGASLYSRASRRVALRRVALMPQSLALPSHLTALEAVAYLTWMRGARWRDATRAAHMALVDVGLADRVGTRIRTLSGGMHRRIALAQAIALDPEVLLLDEPTTGLDPQHRREILDLVAGLDHELVMSSHLIEDVATICSRVVVLHRGRVVFDGTTEQLRTLAPDSASPRALEDAFLAVVDAAKVP
ncbi:ABC transporter ATP-binding protein [Demequina sediminis]|uniref:ABC transporter ATP-binding protein n=1 Tax=Demequina sediminis TaxID=1930058 RepID=UPI0031E64F0E